MKKNGGIFFEMLLLWRLRCFNWFNFVRFLGSELENWFFFRESMIIFGSNFVGILFENLLEVRLIIVRNDSGLKVGNLFFERLFFDKFRRISRYMLGRDSGIDFENLLLDNISIIRLVFFMLLGNFFEKLFWFKTRIDKFWDWKIRDGSEFESLLFDKMMFLIFILVS